MENMQHILDQLNQGWVITVAVMVVELLLRTFKTQEPKSLLYVLSNVFKMISQVCTWLANLMDSVLQNLKDDPPKNP